MLPPLFPLPVVRPERAERSALPPGPALLKGNCGWGRGGPRGGGMSGAVGAATPVRRLPYGLLQRLAAYIDPQDGWRRLAADIVGPSGESRYTQLHIRSRG